MIHWSGPSRCFCRATRWETLGGMGSSHLFIASVVGAVAVACAGPPAARHDPAERLNYVAMGDSIAAAPGVPDPAPPPGCRKSTNNYPSVLARRLLATKFIDVTCSGATSEDIARRAQQTGSGPIARQIDALGATTDLITITIGGNDVGLPADAEACVVKSANPRPCVDQFVVGDVDRISAVISAQVPVWSALLDELRGKAPNARIILVGYGIFVRPGGCFPGQPVLPQDSDYLQSKLSELDDRQRQLAAEKGIDYFDTRPLSQGHDICAPPSDRYIAGYAASGTAIPLHPTASGSASIGTALAGYIGAAKTQN
jgi:lysophospholipase L1-like esterase